MNSRRMRWLGLVAIAACLTLGSCSLVADLGGDYAAVGDAGNDGAPSVEGGCAFNGQAVAAGGQVQAYAAPTVPPDQTCQSQSRTCSDAGLSGSFTYASCTVLAPTSCTAQTLANCAVSVAPNGDTSGECASGTDGGCSYTCQDGGWTYNADTCAGTASYMTTGCNPITIPNYKSWFRITLNGAGGGGTSEGNYYTCASSYIVAGSAGGDSTFAGLVAGGGGGGGTGSGQGGADGGDTNIVGGGSVGGTGLGNGGCDTAVSGSPGGQVVSTYLPSLLAPGSVEQLCLGEGGAPGPNSGSGYTMIGNAGANGSAQVVWH